MAILGGTTGNVSMASGGNHDGVIDLNVFSWTADTNADIETVDHWGITGGKLAYKGNYVTTGTVSCWHDDSVAGTMAAADFYQESTANLTLTAATGQTYVGLAHVHGVSIQAAQGPRPAQITFNFTVDGDWTPN